MKLTHNQKDSFWSLIIIALLVLFIIKCGTPAPAHNRSTIRNYEVSVRYQLGGCYGTRTFVVQAQSITEAKRAAEREAQLSLNASARSVREVR